MSFQSHSALCLISSSLKSVNHDSIKSFFSDFFKKESVNAFKVAVLLRY